MYRGQDERKAELSEVERGLRVTYRNMKTGMVEKKDPYILRVVGEGGNKAQYWERPAGSGNLWSHAHGGKAIGRWDASQPEGKRFLKDAPHIDWQPPETEDQILARKYATQEAEIKALKAELESIQAENKQKAKPKAADKV